MTQAADPLSPALWPEPLRRAFSNLPPQSWTIALSGGLDSVVLLHLAVAWQRHANHPPRELKALHINHGLQSHANHWARRCQSFCDDLGVRLHIATVAVDGDSGRGLEDAARVARYRAFSAQLRPGDALLLGHHADDQAETQLYRMMRGAGLAGWSAMPGSRPLGQGWLFRPLLCQTRRDLRELAIQGSLEWIEDPSNLDERYDRNFLRQRVLPLLRERWPDVSLRMARNAAHARESLQLLEERARDDAREVLDAETGDLYLAPLRQLSPPRQRNLVQWWLRHRGLAPLNENLLLGALADFLAAPRDGNAEIAWQGRVLKRYDDRVLVLDQSFLSTPAGSETWHPTETLQWGRGQLAATEVRGQGLALAAEPLLVRSRGGGEVIELDNGQHQPLKKWLQGLRIPPWERAAMPLIWSGDTLVAVGNLWLHPRYRAAEGQPGWQIFWHPPRFRAAEMASGFTLSD